jgi:hypothetical protein
MSGMKELFGKLQVFLFYTSGNDLIDVYRR